MQLLVKLLINSLYGKQIREDIEDEFASKSEYWVLTEWDQGARDYWIISNGKYSVRLAEDEELKIKLIK